jgi:hypothetical protein
MPRMSQLRGVHMVMVHPAPTQRQFAPESQRTAQDAAKQPTLQVVPAWQRTEHSVPNGQWSSIEPWLSRSQGPRSQRILQSQPAAQSVVQRSHRCVQQPPPQLGQVSPESQQSKVQNVPGPSPTPQQKLPQGPSHSEPHEHSDSPPVQQPSPHDAGQSSGQLQAVSLPVQQVSPQMSPHSGQVHADSPGEQQPSVQLAGQSPGHEQAVSPTEHNVSPQVAGQSATQVPMLSASTAQQTPSPHIVPQSGQPQEVSPARGQQNPSVHEPGPQSAVQLQEFSSAPQTRSPHPGGGPASGPPSGSTIRASGPPSRRAASIPPRPPSRSSVPVRSMLQLTPPIANAAPKASASQRVLTAPASHDRRPTGRLSGSGPRPRRTRAGPRRSAPPPATPPTRPAGASHPGSAPPRARRPCAR